MGEILSESQIPLEEGKQQFGTTSNTKKMGDSKMRDDSKNTLKLGRKMHLKYLRSPRVAILGPLDRP
jgi:hypothetical protein